MALQQKSTVEGYAMDGEPYCCAEDNDGLPNDLEKSVLLFENDSVAPLTVFEAIAVHSPKIIP